ncbi:MAG: hypothetical protein AAGJ93_07945, partial [Bacteroidota bacterium]
MIQKIDAVFKKMAKNIELNRTKLLAQNKLDVADYSGDDQSLYDRLIISYQNNYSDPFMQEQVDDW